MTNNKIGITEGADPTVNFKWIEWVKSGKPAILITKNPELLTHYLHKDYNVIIHCTITGLGSSEIEPLVPKPEISLQAYHDICKFYSPKRVVLRIDPIVYWDRNKNTIKQIANEAEGRVRISFMDLYPHAHKKFLLHGLDIVYDKTFHMPLSLREEAWKELGKPEICCEPDMPSVPCVSKLDCDILGIEPNANRKGQRPLCGCLANKIELCTRPPKCTYGCLYCYWK
jgi:hypothetical protein